MFKLTLLISVCLIIFCDDVLSHGNKRGKERKPKNKHPHHGGTHHTQSNHPQVGHNVDYDHSRRHNSKRHNSRRGRYYSGHYSTPKSCNGDWSSKCRLYEDVSCGDGSKTWCNVDGEIERIDCEVLCPTDAHWTIWGEWSGGCSFMDVGKTCGDDGFQIRFRECVEGVNGGLSCEQLEGPDHELQTCSLCCPVDAVWSSWSGYSDCLPDDPSVTCGTTGTRTHLRNCTSQSCCGRPCYNEGDDLDTIAQESMSCELDCCPVHAVWSPWEEYSACSTPCGEGSKKRERFCTNGSCEGDPCVNDGEDLQTLSEETTTCNLGCCPGECVDNSECGEDGTLVDCEENVCQDGECRCEGYFLEAGVEQCQGELSCTITSHDEATYTFPTDNAVISGALGLPLIRTFHDSQTLLADIQDFEFMLIATSTTPTCPAFSVSAHVRPDSDATNRQIRIQSYGQDVIITDGSNVPMTYADTSWRFEFVQEGDYVVFRNDCGVKVSFGADLTQPSIIIKIVMPEEMLDSRVDGACGSPDWPVGELLDKNDFSYDPDSSVEITSWVPSYYI